MISCANHEILVEIDLFHLNWSTNPILSPVVLRFKRWFTNTSGEVQRVWEYSIHVTIIESKLGQWRSNWFIKNYFGIISRKFELRIQDNYTSTFWLQKYWFYWLWSVIDLISSEILFKQSVRPENQSHTQRVFSVITNTISTISWNSKPSVFSLWCLPPTVWTPWK